MTGKPLKRRKSIPLASLAPQPPNRRFAVRANVFLFSIFSKGCCSLLSSLHTCSEGFLRGTSTDRAGGLRKQSKMVRPPKAAAPCSKNRSIISYFVRKDRTCHLPYDLEKLLTHDTFRYRLHQRHGYSQCLTITVNLQFQRISSRFGIQHFL